MCRYLIFTLCLIGALVLLAGCETSKFPSDVNPHWQYMITLTDGLPMTGGIKFYDLAWGKSYSFDSENIFYIGRYLWCRKPDHTWPTRIIPDSLICTDQTYLAGDVNTQTIYFAANGDIYSIRLDGTQLQNLTPANTDTLRNPSLSPDKRYLTMIRQGKINRLDLQTGIQTEIPSLYPTAGCQSLFISVLQEEAMIPNSVR
ncbi:MAG: hypothetical protein FJ042_04845 [Candidatus Cloacimonetes bacterium]|nr:hypothetical protein [Candidatus Cloacimonadota bacterium]